MGLSQCLVHFKRRQVQEGRWQRLLVVALPLLLFAVACGLGLWAVFAKSQGEAHSRRASAMNDAQRYSSNLELALQSVFFAARALSLLVRGTPGHNVQDMEQHFGEWAGTLLNISGLGPTTQQIQTALQLVPSGVVTHVHPIEGHKSILGKNVIRDTNNGLSALESIVNNTNTLVGPYVVNQGFLAALVRVPVFVKGNWPRNETFGAPEGLDPRCPDFCYHSGHEEGDRFWGFIMAAVRWDSLLESMQFQLLENAGYYYRLVRPWIPHDGPTGKPEFIMGQSQGIKGSDTISVPVNIPEGLLTVSWTLHIVPHTPFMPAWRWPMMAVVIVGALLASLLLWWILEANHRLRTAGRALRNEKARMDALLQRQYDLIKCLGDRAVINQGAIDGGHQELHAAAIKMSLDSQDSDATVDGLEASIKAEMARSAACAGMRRVSQASAGCTGPDITLLDLLGKGTFGKVYRGMWRCSPVAVKTLLLPASLSPDEKREKMVVMETAIASSLSHPNIVQTYTYSIRSLQDSSSSSCNLVDASGSYPSPSVVVVGGDSHAVGSPRNKQQSTQLLPATGNINGSRRDKLDPARRGVHSYEVQLVLEFCDLGCLRDALDSGAFFTGQGTLNLAAILDTAADVARAMVHLHACGVVHGDLKAANVMLKSGGADGRGAVTKVMDFGLSVRMDTADSHVSQMFQGTITHMAPEVLLEGRLGKASDVYAFAITLYELFTGGMAYKGLPRALLPHRVVTERLRPQLPPVMPPALRHLITRCWDHDPAARPSFEEVLVELMDMRAAVGGPTPPLNIRNPFPGERELSLHHGRRGGRQQIMHAAVNEAAAPGQLRQASHAQPFNAEQRDPTTPLPTHTDHADRPKLGPEADDHKPPHDPVAEAGAVADSSHAASLSSSKHTEPPDICISAAEGNGYQPHICTNASVGTAPSHRGPHTTTSLPHTAAPPRDPGPTAPHTPAAGPSGCRNTSLQPSADRVSTPSLHSSDNGNRSSSVAGRRCSCPRSHISIAVKQTGDGGSRAITSTSHVSRDATPTTSTSSRPPSSPTWLPAPAGTPAITSQHTQEPSSPHPGNVESLAGASGLDSVQLLLASSSVAASPTPASPQLWPPNTPRRQLWGFDRTPDPDPVPYGGESDEREEGMLVLETPEALVQALAEAGGGEGSEWDVELRGGGTGDGGMAVFIPPAFNAPTTPGGSMKRRRSCVGHRSCFMAPMLPVVQEEEGAGAVCGSGSGSARGRCRGGAPG